MDDIIIFHGKKIPLEVVRHCREYRRKRLSPVISQDFGGHNFFARKSRKLVRLSESVAFDNKHTGQLISLLEHFE